MRNIGWARRANSRARSYAVWTRFAMAVVPVKALAITTPYGRLHPVQSIECSNEVCGTGSVTDRGSGSIHVPCGGTGLSCFGHTLELRLHRRGKRRFGRSAIGNGRGSALVAGSEDGLHGRSPFLRLLRIGGTLVHRCGARNPQALEDLGKLLLLFALDEGRHLLSERIDLLLLLLIRIAQGLRPVQFAVVASLRVVVVFLETPVSHCFSHELWMPCLHHGEVQVRSSCFTGLNVRSRGPVDPCSGGWGGIRTHDFPN